MTSSKCTTTTSKSVLETAIDRGRAFLQTRVLADRYYLSGVSDVSATCPVDKLGHVFCAYFIIRALIPGGLDKEICKKVSQRFKDEERDGLWGFGKNVLVDSDDTALVLRTRHLLQEQVRWTPLLGFHSPSSNWFRSFRSKSDGALVAIPNEANNRQAHAEVNANIFALIANYGGGAFMNLEGLARAQSADGHWSSYFYPNPFYGTWMVLQCLAPTREYQGNIERAKAFLEQSQLENGAWGSPADPYQSSLALNGLLEINAQDSEVYRRGIDQLITMQQADGSWQSDEIIYQYVASDDSGEVWTAKDVNHVLTTSLTLSALQQTP